MRVDAGVVGFHGDFGALARIAGGFADFEQAVFDFGHFHFKQLHQKIVRGAAEHHLFAAGVADFIHTQKERAHAVAVAEVFARNHLIARQQGIELADFDNGAVAFHALDGAHHDVFFALQEIIQDLLALGIADALQNQLLGGLRGLAAEAFVFQLLFVIFADLDGGAGNFFLNFFDGFFHIGVGVVFINHNQPAAEGAVFAAVAVDFHAHIHMLAAGFFLGGSAQRKFERAEYHFGIHIFFAGQGFGQLQQFTTHGQDSPLTY